MKLFKIAVALSLVLGGVVDAQAGCFGKKCGGGQKVGLFKGRHKVKTVTVQTVQYGGGGCGQASCGGGQVYAPPVQFAMYAPLQPQYVAPQYVTAQPQYAQPQAPQKFLPQPQAPGKTLPQAQAPQKTLPHPHAPQKGSPQGGVPPVEQTAAPVPEVPPTPVDPQFGVTPPPARPDFDPNRPQNPIQPARPDLDPNRPQVNPGGPGDPNLGRPGDPNILQPDPGRNQPGINPR